MKIFSQLVSSFSLNLSYACQHFYFTGDTFASKCAPIFCCIVFVNLSCYFLRFEKSEVVFFSPNINDDIIDFWKNGSIISNIVLYLT